ncbi:MAG: envelope stress response membrane protein PspB [Gammaproteobacteria bacterium]|nr:envelope stress response membrane protein PspB [Gammaproteobacteria bacterium]
MSGSIFAFILAVITLGLIVPTAIVLHYVTKWKSLRGLSDEEQDQLETLWRDSQAMADRINALETILDDTTPEWRSRR